MKSRSTKMMAVLMVSLMAVVALAPLAGEETDAAVGDGGTYSYTLTYHADQMANTAAQETQLTVDGMTPISHASGTTTLTALANEGSWSFNTTTGIGPFNSFYGAFDIDNGNKFVARLNPYDLSKTISGDTLPAGNYNIMWILPTVYWIVDQSGNLTLTNDPTAGGTAYAHTIDGHLYKYLAIGVYSGSYDTTQLKLTSTTNSTPIVNMTRSDARTLAHNYTMDASLTVDQNYPAYSMLWNYYQWRLSQLCSLMVMEGFNSQAIVGNGPLGILPANCLTGQGDALGPYAGLIGNPTSNDEIATYGSDIVKLFIENNWGYYTFVDGVVYYNLNMYVDSNHTPTDTTTTGDSVTSFSYGYLPGQMDGYGQYIYHTVGSGIPEYNWGLVNYENLNGSATIGTTDALMKGSQSTPTNYSMAIGGYAPNGANFQTGQFSRVGVNSIRLAYVLDATSPEVTSRLAFVFDADPPKPTSSVSFDVDNIGYGSLSSSTSIDVETGSEITITGTTGNVLTIGDTTITATPTAATSDYTYSFDGWFNGSTQLQTGDTVDNDMTITAKFSRASILTVTLDAGKGTVSSSSLTVVEGQPIGDLPTPAPKAGYTFTGWFDSEGNEVTSETIVTETESFTLYAQYELDDSLKPVKAMTDLLPLIFVVGIIILMIGTAFYYYRP